MGEVSKSTGASLPFGITQLHSIQEVAEGVSEIPPIAKFLPPASSTKKGICGRGQNSISVVASAFYGRNLSHSKLSQGSGIDADFSLEGAAKRESSSGRSPSLTSSLRSSSPTSSLSSETEPLSQIKFPSAEQKHTPPQQTYIIEPQHISITRDQAVACAVSGGDDTEATEFCFRSDIVTEDKQQASLYFVTEDPSIEGKFQKQLIENLSGKTTSKQVMGAIDKTLDQLGITDGFTCLLERRTEKNERKICAVSRGTSRMIIQKSRKKGVKQLNEGPGIVKVSAAKDDCFVILSSAFSSRATASEVAGEVHVGESAEMIATSLLTKAYESGITSKCFVMTIQGKKVAPASATPLRSMKHRSFCRLIADKLSLTALKVIGQGKVGEEKIKVEQILDSCTQRMSLGIGKHDRVRQQVSYMQSYAGVLGTKGAAEQFKAFFHKGRVESFDASQLEVVKKYLTPPQRVEFTLRLQRGEEVGSAFQAVLDPQDPRLESYGNMGRIQEIARQVEEDLGPIEEQVSSILIAEKAAVMCDMNLSSKLRSTRLALLQEIESNPSKVVDPPYNVQFTPFRSDLF